MTNQIPSQILSVYSTIQEAGYEVYLIGGCVRNMLLEKEVKDWDLTTNATPEEILALFPSAFYDNAFGTVGIPLETQGEKLVVEVTTYRTEHGYSDNRRPDKVKWGKTIEEDLARRDFTINAIAMKLEPKNQNLTTSLVDPYKGQQDLVDGIITAVGDPKKRFKEDALRLMRAIRIATVFSFMIEEHTWKEIVKDAKLITNIAVERIHDELMKILASDYPYEGIMLLKNSGLLEYILPELLEGIGISQARPGRHHTADVFTHNVMSLKFCTSTDPVVRFSTLLHDVGKSRVVGQDQEGLVIFHNHEIVGARMVQDIAERLKFSKKDRDKIVNLIRWHMFAVNENLSDAGIRRFIRRVGAKNVKDMMDLRVGDRLGGGTQTAESWRLKLFKKRVEEQLKPAPFSINDLAIDGHDIMKELGIKPGSQIGQLLKKLFEEVDEDLSKNNRDFLLQRIKELSKNLN